MSKIIDQAKDFVKNLKSIDGALVIGSAAYEQNTPDKDVDLMIISTNILETLTSPPLQKLDELAGLKAESRLEYADSRLKHLNLSHCFKGCLDGVLWSPAIYSPKDFKNIINLYSGYIYSIRSTPNSGIKIKLFDFRGAKKEHIIPNATLDHGYFLANEPVYIKDKSVYFGPAPDALLKSPVICVDNNGKLKSLMVNFWDNVFSLMSKESKDPKKLLLTGKLPIISEKDLPESVYKHIRQELSSARERAKN